MAPDLRDLRNPQEQLQVKPTRLLTSVGFPDLASSNLTLPSIGESFQQDLIFTPALDHLSSCESYREMRQVAIKQDKAIFPLFSFLPKELRYAIWKHALPNPRVVKYPVTPRLRGYYDEVHYRCDATNSKIAINHVCKEAQEVVQRSYSKLYINMIEDRAFGRAELPFLYVDYSIDTVYIDMGPAAPRTREPHERKIYGDLSCVKNLAVNWLCIGLSPYLDIESAAVLPDCPDDQAHLSNIVKLCPDLESLSVVHLPFSVEDTEEFMLWDGCWEYTCPYLHPRDYTRELAFLELPVLSNEHGMLRFLSVCGDWLLKMIREIPGEEADCELPVKTQVVLMAEKGKGFHSPGAVFYYVDDNETARHCHTEYVMLPADGRLVNCQKHRSAEGEEESVCSHCGESRWRTSSPNGKLFLDKESVVDFFNGFDLTSD